MSYDKYFCKNMYKIGSFFQLNWYNPLYLDKTGLVMSKTQENLNNWRGGIDGFVFDEINKEYSGNVNIQKLWLGDSNSEWLRDCDITDFQENIKNDVITFTENYLPEYFSRIGFRIQLLLNKSDEYKILKYNNLYKDKFHSISENFEMKSSNIGFSLFKDDYEIKLNLSFATKNENNSLDSPTKGFLFDIDINKKYDKSDIDNLSDEISNLFEYFNDNFQNIINDIIDGLWKNEK